MSGSVAIACASSLLSIAGFLAGPAAGAPAPADRALDRAPVLVVARCRDGLGISQVVTDRHGVSTATWGCQQRIYAARTRANGSWRRGVRIGTGLEPKAVVDRRSRVTVIYRRLHGNGMESTRWTAGRWQPSTDLTWPTGADVVFVQWYSIAGNARGDIVAFWTQNNGGPESGPRPQLVVAYRPHDGVWNPTVRVGPSVLPQAALVDGAGRAVILSATKLYRRTAAGRWRDPVTMPLDGRMGGAATNPAGDLLVTDVLASTGTDALVALEKPLGSPWAPGVEIGTSPWRWARTPALLGGGGRAEVAYVDGAASLVTANRRAGGSWEPAVRVSATHVGASSPRLVRGPGWALAALWAQSGGLWLSLQPSGGAWSAPVRVTGSRWRLVSHPTVSFRPDGAVVTAWTGRVAGQPGWRFATRVVSLP